MKIVASGNRHHNNPVTAFFFHKYVLFEFFFTTISRVIMYSVTTYTVIPVIAICFKFPFVAVPEILVALLQLKHMYVNEKLLVFSCHCYII